MKPFDLYVSPEHQQHIREGAAFVTVEWTESEHAASGRVTYAGPEDECRARLCTKMVIVPKGMTPHAAVWRSSEVSHLFGADARKDAPGEPHQQCESRLTFGTAARKGTDMDTTLRKQLADYLTAHFERNEQRAIRVGWEPAERDADDGRGGHTTVIVGEVASLEFNDDILCTLQADLQPVGVEEIANAIDDAARGIAERIISSECECDDFTIDSVNADEWPRVKWNVCGIEISFALTFTATLRR